MSKFLGMLPGDEANYMCNRLARAEAERLRRANSDRDPAAAGRGWAVHVASRETLEEVERILSFLSIDPAVETPQCAATEIKHYVEFRNAVAETRTLWQLEQSQWADDEYVGQYLFAAIAAYQKAAELTH